MKLRIFRCRCNHPLRFGASNCSYCFVSTPIWNRWWFVAGIVAIGGGAFLYFYGMPTDVLSYAVLPDTPVKP